MEKRKFWSVMSPARWDVSATRHVRVTNGFAEGGKLVHSNENIVLECLTLANNTATSHRLYDRN